MDLKKKTYIYYGVIVIITLIFMNLKSLDWFYRNYLYVSEESELIYSGKIKAAYNPLDKAYVLSPSFLEEEKKESKFDIFKKYREWPVVSLRIAPEDLNEPERGIIANGLKRGRLWERPVHFHFYEKGKLKFASRAGIRIHGGSSRKNPEASKSFRVYFRKEYGRESLDIDHQITLEKDSKVKRVILRLDKRYYFAHDFGFELTRRLGGIAPNILPVATFINGELYNYHFLVEHQDKEQLRYNFKNIDQFLFYKLKGDNSTEAHLKYEKMRNFFYVEASPLTMDKVKKYIDLDNMTASMITVLYTGMTDWHQGILFKEKPPGDDLWRWMVWDYDNAFLDDRVRIKMDDVKHPWEIPSFYPALEIHQGNVRSIVFKRLLKEDPQYISYFLEKIDYLFDEILTDKFLVNKFKKYEALLKDANSPELMAKGLMRIKNFVKNRKKIFCKQIYTQLSKMPKTCIGVN